MKLILFCILTLISAAPIFLNQEKSLEESKAAGKEIYSDFCITCHMDNGEGVSGVFPPLAQADYLLQNREGSLRGIKFGQSGEITVNGVTYNSVMADLGLSDEEVADVMNYILNSWGNTSPTMVTATEVAGIGPPE